MPQYSAPSYPGIPATADGSTAVVWVERHVSQGAAAYPITPATNMGVGFEAESASGIPNLWGDPLRFLELESEHSAASTCEGFALAGGRVTTFTAGQGLILMKEVLYTIAGKRLPVVFHIGARALTHQALNVHAGHDDIMGVMDTGWGMFFARNAQEAGDLALIARRTAEASQTPCFVVQDGFLTTHTLESVRLPEPEFMREFIGPPNEKLVSLFDPARPLMSGVVQNQDAYMKGKVAQRGHTGRCADAFTEACAAFHNATGRKYSAVVAYKMEDAEFAIVGMGSTLETAAAVVDHLRAAGEKVGCVHVTRFRPFPARELVAALRGCTAVAVIERLDDAMAGDNPLALALKASFATALMEDEISEMPRIIGGCAGLGSRDVRPGDLIAVFHALRNETLRSGFSLGVIHPSALARGEDPDLRPAGSFSMRGHSIGGYGSVTTNKVLAALLAEALGLCVQAYPKYGSEKKGLPTTYYLTAAKARVRIHCELNQVEFVALNDINAFNLGDPLAGLGGGGSLFIQTPLTDAAQIVAALPARAREQIAARGLRLHALDTVRIARECAGRPDLAQRMQGIVLLGVFLKAAPLVSRAGQDEDHLWASVEKALEHFFGKRGAAVVQANLQAVQRGFHEVITIEPARANPDPEATHEPRHAA